MRRFSSRAALASAASLLTASAASAAVMPHSACNQAAANRSATVVSQPRPGGAEEVTEFLPGPEHYRVTRCDATGTLLTSEEVVSLATPSGGRQPTVVSRSYASKDDTTTTEHYLPPDPTDDSPPAAVFREQVSALGVPGPTGGKLLAPPAAGPDASPLHPRARSAAIPPSDNSCSANYWSWNAIPPPYLSPPTLSYYNGYLPTLQTGSFLAAVQYGHNTWDTSANPCGFQDASNLSMAYQGGAFAAFNLGDGISLTDYGPVSGAPSAVAITATRVRNADNHIVESDQRFNSAFTFAICGDGCGQYDVWAISTHETGHQIYLSDLYFDDAYWLSMYGVASKGGRWPRTLGKGDINGMRTVY